MIRRFLLYLSQQKTLLLLVLVSLLLASVYIDARNSVVMPADMRNRMVGSRMIKDGASPYFYIWQAGGPVRYYDTNVPPNSNVSPVTSTPFFHYIASFVADFPQFKLNVFWFALEYLCAGLCCLLAVLAVSSEEQQYKKWLLAAVTILFTYSFGWRNHMNVGQNYIFVPLLAMGCYYCLMQKKDLLHLFLFGLFSCSLILLRPIAILFFLPFLPYTKTYFKWFAAMAVLMVAYNVFVFTNPVQKTNWVDYFKSVKVHTNNHQELVPPPQKVNYNGVFYHSFEGVDIDTEGDLYWPLLLKKGGENSNFFILYNQLTGKKLSVKAMTIGGIAVCFVLLVPFIFFKLRNIPVSADRLLLLGFVIYNTFEFFTPVTRLAYHWVQFLFPLLLAVIYMKRLYLIPTVLLLAGFYLNMVVLPSVKMEHSIGEFLITIGLLLLVYRELITNYINERRLKINEDVYVL